MKIRKIVTELLRAGPRHNQLLSPLTQYLGVCNDSPAGIVHLPYEHAAFMLRLSILRYAVEVESSGRLSTVRDHTGRELADVLGDIPGLAGALKADRDQPDVLTHLRLVLSASELALLPFEMSKMPTGGAASPDSWLVLQSQAPVCLTRHVRSVRADAVHWARRPKILFISGPEVPFDEHRRALEKALEPWDGGGGRGDRLTVLEKATLGRILDACATAADRGEPFTHVHVLAHGAAVEEGQYTSFGISLQDDVTSGRALATALTTVAEGGLHRPAVVTLATCDSGGVGSVVTSEASVAHDLHETGIPLVVASQFPLTVRASVPFVETFYREQLWGVHPLSSLYKVRLELFSRFGHEFHDWASLVIYEAFPNDLADQLDELRYHQVRRAHDAALDRLRVGIERAAAGALLDDGEYRALVDGVLDVRRLFPETGPHATECKGLIASSSKRLAELAYQLAESPGVAPERRRVLREDCYFRLDEALIGYRQAAKDFLRSGEQWVHREATFHWLLSQTLSLELVLGRPFHEAAWMTARLAAETDVAEAGLGWAYGSLMELWLLRLVRPEDDDARRARAADRVLDYAGRIVELCGRDSHQARSARDQLLRYVRWWGQPAFTEALESYAPAARDLWHLPRGLLETARQAARLLRGRRFSPTEPGGGTPGGGTPEPEAEDGTSEPEPDLGTPAAPASEAEAAPPTAPRHRRTARGAVLDVEMLPAENGDCLWIEYGKAGHRHRLLVDCGARSAAGEVLRRIDALPADRRVFELFVLTHVDADHIHGVLPLFERLDRSVRFRDVWFNGWQQLPRDFLSVRQGEAFSDLLRDPERGLPWNGTTFLEDGPPPPAVAISEAADTLPVTELRGGLRLTLLSPGHGELGRLARKWQAGLREMRKGHVLGRKAPPAPITDPERFDVEALARTPFKKDTSVANGSSIAFLAEFEGKSVILAGDAHAEVMAGSIRKLLSERGQQGEKLRVDALKLSHHGSKNGLSKALLDLLDCPRFLVSSDGSRFYHPDREAIARAIVYGGSEPTLCFNYRSPLNELWNDPRLQERYGYSVSYPEGDEPGLRVSL